MGPPAKSGTEEADAPKGPPAKSGTKRAAAPKGPPAKTAKAATPKPAAADEAAATAPKGPPAKSHRVGRAAAAKGPPAQPQSSATPEASSADTSLGKAAAPKGPPAKSEATPRADAAPAPAPSGAGALHPSEEAVLEPPNLAAPEGGPVDPALGGPAVDPCGGKPYVVEESVKNAILAATTAGEVDVKTRNQLYRGIARMFERPNVNASIMAKWDRDKTKNVTKFAFLQEWVRDTSCATMLATELHERSSENVNEKGVKWLTKFEIYSRYSAYASSDAMAYCDLLIAKAKSRPNTDPQLRKNKMFTQYKVSTADKEVTRAAVKHTTRFELSSQVTEAPEVAASAIRQLGSGLERPERPPPAGNKRAAKKPRAAATRTQGAVPTKAPDAIFCAMAVNKCQADVAGALSTARDLLGSAVLRCTTTKRTDG